MGNASRKSDGEGTSSGVTYGGEYYEQEGMEFAGHGSGAPPSLGYHGQGMYAEAEPMVHSPPHGPMGFLHPPPLFTPQVPMAPLPRSGEITYLPNYTLVHNIADSRDMVSEKPRTVMIIWNYDGEQVAVTGSWDNWNTREPLQKLGRDFIIMKMLQSGVYHYRFIVDENLRYAPDLPWERDDSGAIYNILDVQDYVPEAPESLSEFESPPSPVSSYNNESINENDSDKPPPDVPPLLQLTPLNAHPPGLYGYQSQQRPRHAVLNHLYIQSSRDEPVALGTTHRFLQKYVTVVLYKPTRR